MLLAVGQIMSVAQAAAFGDEAYDHSGIAGAVAVAEDDEFPILPPTAPDIGPPALAPTGVLLRLQSSTFRNEVETEKFGFYPSATWLIADSTSLTYELEYTSQELPFDRGVVFSEEFGFSPRELFVGEPVPIETEVVGHQVEFEHMFTDN